ncbi:MAG: hypothetical protein RIA72_06990 [Sphingopyxis sp.]|uniref:hypothetical protein n=1 Tax=Sphingopyxis sp. TaxID=1908224 RepID=UPI0032EC1BC3
MAYPYVLAQDAMAKLREAIYLLLTEAPASGLKNAQIGRSLGIYSGHVGHEGHISRTVLALMEAEGVVEQNAETKCWRIRDNKTSDSSGNNQQ